VQELLVRSSHRTTCWKSHDRWSNPLRLSRPWQPFEPTCRAASAASETLQLQEELAHERERSRRERQRYEHHASEPAASEVLSGVLMDESGIGAKNDINDVLAPL